MQFSGRDGEKLQWASGNLLTFTLHAFLRCWMVTNLKVLIELPSIFGIQLNVYY